MKIRTTIKLKNALASEIVTVLDPDNMSNMVTHTFKDYSIIEFDTEKITTLIATMDDLLMNAKIAEEIIEKLNEKE